MASLGSVGHVHTPVVAPTPDQQLQDVQNRVANRGIGGKIASWVKSIVGKPNPSSVAFRAAITAKLGGDAAAAKAVFDKFGIKDSTSLSSTKAANAIAFASRVEGWKAEPLYQAMGHSNFVANLTGAEATMAAHGVKRSDVPLTDAEVVALREYTEQSFYSFNSEIRSGAESPLTSAQRAAMESGLAKLPPFTGQVHRGADLPEDADKAHRKGATVSDRTFTSTAASTDAAFPGSHQFVIQSQTGRDISFLSSRPDEREVLFPPGTQFQVLDRQGGHGGYFAGKAIGGNVQLVMKEV